jgi:hypothetical protein
VTDSRLVEYAFVAGLDQGNDPRRTVKLTVLSNYQWTKRGMIEKRCGYAPLPIGIWPPPTSEVTGITLTAGGSGYPANVSASQAIAFFVSFTGGGGGGALAYAATGPSGGAVTSVTLAFGGSGFTSAPTPVFTPPTGSGFGGAAATATIGTVPGGSLAAVYSLAVSSQGTIQATDATSVYGYSGGSGGIWTKSGNVPAITVSTVQAPLQGEPTPYAALFSGASVPVLLNPVDWELVACNGLRVWWTSDFYVVQAESGAVLSQSGTPLGGVSPITLVTDATSHVWMFTIVGGSGASVFETYFLEPSATGSTSRTYVPSTPAPSGTIWFDATWNPSFDILAIARATTNATVYVEGWYWSNVTNAFSLAWTEPVKVGGGSGAAIQCLSVSVGASGDTYVAIGYEDSLTSPATYRVDAQRFAGSGGSNISGVINVFAGAGGSAAGAPTTTLGIQNVSVLETNTGGVFSVAFTALDAATLAGGFYTNTVYSLDLISPGSSCGVVGGTKGVGLALYSRLWSQAGAPAAVTYHTGAESFYVHNFTGNSDATAIISGGVVPTIPPAPMAIFNGREGFSSKSLSFQAPFVPSSAIGTLQSSWALSRPIQVAGGVQLLTCFSPDPAQTTLLQMQVATITTAAQGTPEPVYTSTFYPCALPTFVGEGTSFEAQFLAPPVIGVGVSSTGGSLSAGTYTWYATYARVFEDGSILESQPSSPVTISNVSAGSVATVGVQQYGLSPDAVYGELTSQLLSRVFVILYRTEANGTAAFRVIGDPWTNYTTGLYMPNNPQYNALEFVDGVADTGIASNPELPTSGNTFDNVCPNSVTMAARVRDRLWLAGTPDGATVYYSDAITNGVGSCNFHDEQTLFVAGGETVTGIGTIDNNVYLFTASAIYVVYGAEGSSNGSGNTLTTPQKIPVGGIGCISPNSVVNVTQGVYFQSTRGIELLDRSQSISFAGEAVKDVALGTVVAAIAIPTLYQVRFYGSSGALVVLSTLTGEWSTWTYPVSSAPTTAATLYEGAVVWAVASAPPSIQIETPGVYSDNGVWISSAWTTGWITVGEGLEGYRRYRALQLLGTWDGESGATVTLMSNYATSGGAVYAWSSTQIEAIAGFNGSVLQLEALPAVQRAESVQVAFVDAAPADAALTKGIAWESLTFEVFGKPGRFRGLAAGAKG